jgi:HTH-type transcriptional regulator, cell division transcriptional repressor
MSDPNTDVIENGWFSEDQATFGDRLAGAREAAGLSQEELSRRLGVKLETVRGWEDDMVEPRGNKLQMLAGLMNVSIRWLLTGEGDGLEGPTEAAAALAPEAAEALAELAQMRARALTLAREMGQIERRLRNLLRTAAA